MYEVEVKARLGDRNAVIKKLKSLDCKFGKELHQIDHIFIEGGISFPPPIGTPVLRVRKQGKIYFFTLKISQNNRTDSIEREMEISEGEKMIEILKLLKWQETVLVDKRRVKTKYKNMEIVLDNVQGLGEFIEAERIVKNHNHAERIKIQEELYSFLETIGVAKEDHVRDGKYDIMLFEIKNKLGVK